VILLRGPYSQTELSEVLHVKQQSISDWEKGLGIPTPRHYRGLLAHFYAWYVTDHIEEAATLALKLLTPKKPLTTTQPIAKRGMIKARFIPPPHKPRRI
jgi:transcriptional regulator with XRE-family HTH domain